MRKGSGTLRNKYRVDGETVYIQLDHKDGSFHEAQVSKSKLPKLLEFDIKWVYMKRKKEHTAYVMCSKHIGKKPTTIMLHRFLVDAPDGYVVDHFDGNGLNNLDDNMRVVTQQVNAQNKTVTNSRNKSGIRGVHWDKRTSKWRVDIVKDGNHHVYGRFTELDEAAEVARRAYEELYTGVKIYAKP